jgi:hypothetical protein
MDLELSIENYLKPTEYCDFNHPDIISKVNELTKADKTPISNLTLTQFYHKHQQQ